MPRSAAAGRAPKGRPRRPLARGLSALWWVVGWLAYCAVCAVGVVAGTNVAAQRFEPWPTAVANAAVVFALTVFFYRTGTLGVVVRVVAPLLFVLLLLFFTLFSPPAPPARVTRQAAHAPPHGWVSGSSGA